MDYYMMEPDTTIIMNPDEKLADDVGIDYELIKPLLDRTTENQPVIQSKFVDDLFATKLDDDLLKPNLDGDLFKPNLDEDLFKPKSDEEPLKPRLDQELLSPKPDEEPIRFDPDEKLLKQKPDEQTLKPNPDEEPLKNKSDQHLPRPKREIVKSRSHMRLRNRGSAPRMRENIWVNYRLEKIRQRAFCQRFETYHDKSSMPDDESATKLLELSKKTQLSQVDKFEYENRHFIVVTWLSVIRLLEYNPNNNTYFEIRRIPRRYIGFEFNLITSVHHRDSKLYIAYIDSTADRRSYIEVRTLNGDLSDSYSYDYVIKSIHSSEHFIYVKTTQNILYVHKRGAFTFNPYRIDMRSVTDAPLVNVYARPVISGHMSYLNMLIATPESLIISKRDAREHCISQNYNFSSMEDSQYRTISMELHDSLILIHRNLTSAKIDYQPRSKLEIGRLTNIKVKSKGEDYFVHQRSIGFTYEILQIDLSSDGESVFVLGRSSTMSYEVGQLRLKDIKPIWSAKVNNVDANSRILAQPDHLVIIPDYQRNFVLSQEHYQHHDAGILREVTQRVNKLLIQA